jgi:hypothetical protein
MQIGSYPEDDPNVRHYTTGQGLIGIFQTGCIWASSILFLNDSSEINHTFRLARRYVAGANFNELQRVLVDLAVDRAGGTTDNPFLQTQYTNVYVASFSNKGDDLNQWRGYASKNGYAIGFSRKLIRSLAAREGFSFEKVRYADKEKYELLSPKINEYLRHCDRLGLSLAKIKSLKGCWPWPGESELANLADEFSSQLSEVAPLIKDAAFAEEEEWRLVAKYKSTERLNYRDTATGLIPYVAMNLKNEDKLEVRMLVVGPSPRQWHAITASELAASTFGVACKAWSTSTVPYRNW